MFRLRWFFLFFIWFGLSIGICVNASEDGLDEEFSIWDRILAVVGSEIVTQSELYLWKEHWMEQPGGASSSEEEFLRQLVAQKAQVAYAKHLGMSVTDSQVEQIFNQLAQKNGMPTMVFLQRLQAEGTPLAIFKENVRSRLLLEYLHNRILEEKVSITSREIRKYWQEVAAHSKASVDYLHIYLPCPIEGCQEKKHLKDEERFYEYCQLSPENLNWASGTRIMKNNTWRRWGSLDEKTKNLLLGAVIGEVHEVPNLKGGRGKNMICVRELNSERLPWSISETIYLEHLLLPDSLAIDEVSRIYDQLEEGTLDFEKAQSFGIPLGKIAKDGLIELHPWEVPDDLWEEFLSTESGVLGEVVSTPLGQHIFRIHSSELSMANVSTILHYAEAQLKEKKFTEVYRQEIQQFLEEYPVTWMKKLSNYQLPF